MAEFLFKAKQRENGAKSAAMRKNLATLKPIIKGAEKTNKIG